MIRMAIYSIAYWRSNAITQRATISIQLGSVNVRHFYRRYDSKKLDGQCKSLVFRCTLVFRKSMNGQCLLALSNSLETDHLEWLLIPRTFINSVRDSLESHKVVCSVPITLGYSSFNTDMGYP